MSELHDDGMVPDARLRRMLDRAPDADAAPQPATREAILKIARNAVAPSPLASAASAAPPASWWQRLLGRPGGGRMPWNAAFATVFVALFVTVMWHDRPVPDARLDEPAPARAPSLPETAPAPANPAEPAPAPSAPVVPAPAARPAPPAERKAVPEAQQAAPTERIRRERSAAQLKESEERRAAPPASRPAPRAEAPAAAAPPPPAAMADAMPADAARGSVAEAQAPAPAAVPAPAPPPAAAPNAASAGGAAPGAMAQLSRRAPAPVPLQAGAWRAWTHLRIVAPDGRSQRLTRAQAGELAGLLEAAVPAAAASGAAPSQPEGAGWRVVLESQGAPLASLDVGEQRVRWREGGAAPVVAEPPAAVLQALRGALGERLGARN